MAKPQRPQQRWRKPDRAQVFIKMKFPFSFPLKSLKQSPQWIHFTPGNSFLSVWVHNGLTGRRGRHGTFKPPSNNGFVISKQAAASSQSQLPPFSAVISPPCLPLSPRLPVWFPPQVSPPISLCSLSCLYLWQLQTLLAVIGYSSQPWNDSWETQTHTLTHLNLYTTHISCSAKVAVSVYVACDR